MDFEKLFDDIKLPDVARKNFWELHKKCSDESFCYLIEKAYEMYSKGDAAFGECLKEFSAHENVTPDELTLYIYLLRCELTLKTYAEKGIDPKIFHATMKDFCDMCKIHYDRTGICGIPQVIYRPWFRKFIDCTIYRLGRFNFEIIKSEHAFEIEGIKINPGDTCISVHIPGGMSLDEEFCEESFDMARRFFREHFDMNPPVFFCESWLLQPWLCNALPESSRIVRFQRKFEIIDFIDNPEDGLVWVFPELVWMFPNRPENPDDYPENTSVQRATKERLKRGETVGCGRGVRL